MVRTLSVVLLLVASSAMLACARSRHEDVLPSPAFEVRTERVVLREPEPVATPAWEELVACQVADDCVIVEMGCCEGEWTMSIASEAQDEADRRWAKDCPRGRRCFAEPVHGWVEEAVCDHGTCARIEDQLVVRPNGSWSSGLVLVHTSEPPWGSRPPPTEAQLHRLPSPR